MREAHFLIAFLKFPHQNIAWIFEISVICLNWVLPEVIKSRASHFDGVKIKARQWSGKTGSKVNIKCNRRLLSAGLRRISYLIWRFAFSGDFMHKKLHIHWHYFPRVLGLLNFWGKMKCFWNEPSLARNHFFVHFSAFLGVWFFDQLKRRIEITGSMERRVNSSNFWW